MITHGEWMSHPASRPKLHAFPTVQIAEYLLLADAEY
jgi:hypothetical protein